MAELVRVADHESGMEAWVKGQGTEVSVREFRAPDGAVLRFEAFTGTKQVVRQVIGARITTRRSTFDRAVIRSGYLLLDLNRVHHDSDSDSNDTFVEEYEWKFAGLGALPTRVESLCMALWHGVRVRAIVSAGEPRTPVNPNLLAGVDDAYPADWPRMDRVEVSPTDLRYEVALRGGSTEKVTCRNWSNTLRTIEVRRPTHAQFSTTTGTFTVAPNGSKVLSVRFEAGANLRPVSGALPIVTDRGTVSVRLSGSVRHDNR